MKIFIHTKSKKEFFFTLIFNFIIFPQIYSKNSYDNCIFLQSSLGPFLPIHPFPSRFNETALVLELPKETDARCLDGTSYKFNFSRGVDSGSKKFFFFFDGGGFCGIEDKTDVLSSCKSRSEGFEGSSKFFPPNNTVTMVSGSGGNLGYFSSSSLENPKFWNWNKIGINYCDGTIHQGYLKEPVNVNGTELWFRGYNNTMGVFEWARKNLGLFEAEEILIGGESSGGQAAFFWASYLQDYFPKNIKVAALSDAGYFIDEYSQNAGCNLFGYYIKEIANVTKTEDTDLLRGCRYRDGDEKWKCLIPQYITDDIEIPFFLLNSQNDFLVLLTQFYVFCVEYGTDTCSSYEREQITLFRQKFLENIFAVKKKQPKWGFWLRNCLEHVYYNTWAWYTDQMRVFNAEINEAVDLKSAFYEWYFNLNENVSKSHTYIDLISWETACPGDFYRLKDPAEEEKEAMERKNSL